MSALEARVRLGVLGFCAHPVAIARCFLLSFDAVRFSLPLNTETKSMVFTFLFRQFHVEV